MLIDYAKTDRQRQIIEAYEAHGSSRKAAKALGMSKTAINDTVSRVRRYAFDAGDSPEFGRNNKPPMGVVLAKTTVQRGADGQVERTWERLIPTVDSMREIMAEAVEAMRGEIPKEEPVKAPRKTNSDLCSVYVITDYHLGMLSWPDETGDDWNAQIAEDTLVQWFAAAIDAAPDSERAVFAQLGDFMHWDGMDAVTPQNKHILDADTRFQHIVRIAIRVIRRVIRMLLQKHKTVDVLMCEGNHDPASSIWMREIFAEFYAGEDRVVVDTSADPYYCVRHGDTSLFFHHGHKKKMAEIAPVFVAKFREVFGQTRHSYAHMGHLHHAEVKEGSLMIVEQHRTLAAKDAYASRGGWLSGRDAKVITYHKEHGEVMRATINYGALK